MILVALAVVVATAFGVVCERRSELAQPTARRGLQLMLYVLVPFVSFVNVAPLRLTVGAGAGLGFAYLAIGAAGFAAWGIGRWALHLDSPTLGAVICSVILVNTGYLGLPMTVALLGAKNLGSAVAYDQVVSGPMMFIFGFGVGAAFGDHAGDSGLRRLRTFLTKNPPLLAVRTLRRRSSGRTGRSYWRSVCACSWRRSCLRPCRPRSCGCPLRTCFRRLCPPRSTRSSSGRHTGSISA